MMSKESMDERKKNGAREDLIGPLLSRLMEPFQSMEFDQDIRFSCNHLWFKPRDDNGGWRSGLDRFAILALGQVTEIIFPVAQECLASGMNLCWLNHVDGMLVVKSPLEVFKLNYNPQVRDHPSLLLSDPMGSGWLVEGKFDILDSPYIVPKPDMRRWFEEEIDWLKCELETCLRGQMTFQVGETLADGGIFVSDICSALGPVAHRDLLRRIMNL